MRKGTKESEGELSGKVDRYKGWDERKRWGYDKEDEGKRGY